MSTLRQARPELATATHQLGAGLSLGRRPDALSPDHRTAFSAGPHAVGDPSAGLRRRAWRARADAGGVWLARATTGNTAWEAETPLFSYTGAAADELGLAFDQNARAVVCAERATGPDGTPEVWLYHYDTALASYLFTRLGAGRSPRVVLDAPDGTDSDLLVFYVADAADAVAYRQQRDRYATEYATPAVGAAELFLEAAAWDGAGRVRLVLSRRDAAAGTYTLTEQASALYPLFTPGADSPLGAAASLAGIEVRQVVLTPEVAPEGLGFPYSLPSIRVYDPSLPHTAVQEQTIQPAHELRGIAIQTLVITHTQDAVGEPGFTPGHALQGITVRALVISHTQDAAGEPGFVPSAGVQGISIDYVVREIHETGQPQLEENRYDPRHTLLAISVAP